MVKIGRDAELPDSLEAGSGATHHLAFVQLYFHTTRLWLNHLKDQPDSHIGYMVIERFYDLYDLYVGRMIDGRSAQTARHWARYFELLNVLQNGGTPARQWQLVALGARAHTRYDLGEAMYRAFIDYRDIHGDVPDREAFRQVLLDPKTDAVFVSAARDFFAMPRTRREAPDMRGAPILHLGTDLFRRLWVPAFQYWRRAAWADAITRIEAGTVLASPPRI